MRWILAVFVFTWGCAASAETTVASTASPADKVAPDIQLVMGKTAAGSQPDGNGVLIDAPDGLIVFDTGRHAEHTRQVLDVSRQIGKPIRAIINSHWHLDHVGGNVLVRAAFPAVDVYATAAIDDALGGFLASYRKQLADVLAKPDVDTRTAESSRAEIALIDAGAQLKPTRVVEKSSRMTIAGRALELHVERSAVTVDPLRLFIVRYAEHEAGSIRMIGCCNQVFDQTLPVLRESEFPVQLVDLVWYRQQAFHQALLCAVDPVFFPHE